MKKIFFCQVLVCALSFGGALYAYVRQQNDLIKIRIELPKLAKEVRRLEEVNSRLHYDIERFENPKHLMELAKRPEFSHLKHPLLEEVFVLHVQGAPENMPQEVQGASSMRSIFIGAR